MKPVSLGQGSGKTKAGHRERRLQIEAKSETVKDEDLRKLHVVRGGAGAKDAESPSVSDPLLVNRALLLIPLSSPTSAHLLGTVGLHI